jgi:hypothetical protein
MLNEPPISVKIQIKKQDFDAADFVKALTHSVCDQEIHLVKMQRDLAIFDVKIFKLELQKARHQRNCLAVALVALPCFIWLFLR